MREGKPRKRARGKGDGSLRVSIRSPRVAILMGSESDREAMGGAKAVLDSLGVSSETRVLSAHRAPAALVEYVANAESRGVRVFIAGAGMAAHLAGAIASRTTLPVIGVPLASSPLSGLDSLLATVQMPPGIPVATVAIGPAGAKNAGYLAAQMLALSDDKVKEALGNVRTAATRGS